MRFTHTSSTCMAPRCFQRGAEHCDARCPRMLHHWVRSPTLLQVNVAVRSVPGAGRAVFAARHFAAGATAGTVGARGRPQACGLAWRGVQQHHSCTHTHTHTHTHACVLAQATCLRASQWSCAIVWRMTAASCRCVRSACRRARVSSARGGGGAAAAAAAAARVGRAPAQRQSTRRCDSLFCCVLHRSHTHTCTHARVCVPGRSCRRSICWRTC
jgi:hypothetical protein